MPAWSDPRHPEPVIALFAWSADRHTHDTYMQHRLDALFAHLGIDPDAQVCEDVMPMLRSNGKVPAMRIYRRRTGASPRVAMEVIDRCMPMVARERATTPQRQRGTR